MISLKTPPGDLSVTAISSVRVGLLSALFAKVVVRAAEKCNHLFLVDKLHPDQILKDFPDCREYVDTFGVSYSYPQQIADLNLAVEWKKVDVPVLVTWATSDPTTTAEENRYLVDEINSFHAGRATYAEFRGMGHGLDLSPSTRLVRSHPEAPTGEFDQEFLDRVDSWMRGLLRDSEN